ncbi:MAG: 2-hydroxyacyl-CoA dehydratase [Firmicutes bacterium]|nr:2-hydroxyacyl-CoA dehydratase [Bacillota bacterium]
MADYKALIAQLTAVAATPGKSVAAVIKETGKEAFGCFPLHTPEELVYAAGYIPVGMWGGRTEIKLADKYLQGFCCTIIKANIEMGLNGTYKDLKGVIIPCICDTLKCVSEDWIYACPQIPVIPIAYPMQRKIDGAIEYMVEEFRHVQAKLEEISGRKITDEQIEAAFAIYEDYRQAMREFVEVAADYPLTIDAKTRHLIIKAAYFMDKAKYTAIVKDIIAELKQLPKEEAKIKVVVSGLVSEPVEVLDILTENGIAIVADDLSQASRKFRTPARAEGTALEKMAGIIADQKGDTFLYEPEKYKGSMLIDQYKAKKADGIIYFQMKFCDPEEFDFPIVKKEMEEAGIPLLYLEVDQQIDSFEQLRTRIQSFAEIL